MNDNCDHTSCTQAVPSITSRQRLLAPRHGAWLVWGRGAERGRPAEHGQHRNGPGGSHALTLVIGAVGDEAGAVGLNRAEPDLVASCDGHACLSPPSPPRCRRDLTRPHTIRLVLRLTGLQALAPPPFPPIFSRTLFLSRHTPSPYKQRGPSTGGSRIRSLIDRVLMSHMRMVPSCVEDRGAAKVTTSKARAQCNTQQGAGTTAAQRRAQEPTHEDAAQRRTRTCAPDMSKGPCGFSATTCRPRG